MKKIKFFQLVRLAILLIKLFKKNRDELHTIFVELHECYTAKDCGYIEDMTVTIAGKVGERRECKAKSVKVT